MKKADAGVLEYSTPFFTYPNNAMHTCSSIVPVRLHLDRFCILFIGDTMTL